MTNTNYPSAPINDAIIVAVSQLVDDAQLTLKRDPSHSDIEHLIKRHKLEEGDPRNQGQNVGKAKRVKAVLNWSLENLQIAGGQFIYSLISSIRGHGGFRESSSNYIGSQNIQNAITSFIPEGYDLSLDGILSPKLLENLSGSQLTEALKNYIRRAKRGYQDAALLVGTSKDLLEAVAAHILQEKYGNYQSTSNFPTLLGQVFVSLELATPHDTVRLNEAANKRIEKGMYEIACGINQLRNKQGTGHGRPWIPTVTDDEAKMAVEIMGIIAERLLCIHNSKK